MESKLFQVIELQGDILDDFSLNVVKGGINENQADGTCSSGATLNDCSNGGTLVVPPTHLEVLHLW